MECMFDGCNDEFVDNENGLSAMLFHMMQHPPTEVNTPEQNKMCEPEEEY